jgi:hypothetical protein
MEQCIKIDFRLVFSHSIVAVLIPPLDSEFSEARACIFTKRGKRKIFEAS